VTDARGEIVTVELFGDVRANDDSLGAATTARQLVRLEGMVFAANRQKIGKLNLATRLAAGFVGVGSGWAADKLSAAFVSSGSDSKEVVGRVQVH
jgi:hypothetical protein